MTKDEAVTLYASGWWEDGDAKQVARFQLEEPLLCMPFDAFHKAVEEALGRPVWTHEFADREGLLAELNGETPTPENPTQHAMDSLAALALSMGKDPEETIIILATEQEQ